MHRRLGNSWVRLASAALGCGLACAAHHAPAQVPTSPAVNAFGEGSHLNYARDVSQAQTAVYAKVVRAYDEHLQGEPRDAVAGVEKCLFIDQFADSEDNPVESAAADAEKCRADLESVPLVNHPEAQLYLLDRKLGKEAIAAAEADLAAAASWPAPLRARLRAKLAFLYQGQDADKSGSNALASVELDPNSDARLVAAGWLKRIGATARAHALISSTPQQAWERLSAYDAADILIGLGDPTAAASLLRLHMHGADAIWRDIGLAKAFAASGQIGEARRLYALALSNSKATFSTEQLRAHYLFQRDHGSRQEAVAAYERLRDAGYEADPFGYYRLTLSYRYPATPWRWRDVLGVMTLVVLLVFLAATPVLLIAPVHYRGVVRQLRGTLPQAPTMPWRLTHAWYVLAGLLLIGVLSSYFCAYPSFEAAVTPSADKGGGSSEHAVGQALIWHTILFGILTIPLLRGFDFRGLLLGTWSWRRSILTGIGAALLARFVLNLVVHIGQTLTGPAALASDLVQGLNGIRADYGIWAAFLVAAIAVPLLEEFTFRGVLLTAFRRYVSFWPAALAQALAFALLHDDMNFLPFFFAFGLVAALLYRRSGGLLAPIAMHMTFNLLALIAILSATHAIERGH